MSKNFTIIIVSSIIFIILASTFSSSYASREIGNLAYVLALGIDVGEKAKVRVSAQFTKSSTLSSGGEGSSSSDENVVIVSGEADSVFGAMNLLNSYIGKEINLSHCCLIIFSEEYAKKGITTEIYSLMNYEEVRPTTNLVISGCKASEYLKNSNPNLEKLTTQYYETFSITDRFTGFFSNITIGDFYNHLSVEYSDATAVFGGLNLITREKSEGETSGSTENSKNGEGESSNPSESGKTSQEGSGEESNKEKSSQGGSGEESDKEKSSQGGSGEESEKGKSSQGDSEKVVTNSEELKAGESSITGDRGSENLGIAVFKEDKLCCELTAIESICHLLILNRIDSCVLSVDNPISEEENKKMELRIYPVRNTKTDVRIENDIPKIYINIKLNADVLVLDKDVNYETTEILAKISEATESYLKKEFEDYLNKTTKEYGVNIDGFGLKAASNFLTIPQWQSFKWNEKIKNAEFYLNIDVNTLSSMLITKT